MSAVARRAPAGRRWRIAIAAAALLAACGPPAIKHRVLTPPPSAPRAEFFIEKVEVQSREVGDEAWRRNDEYGRVLGDALRAALRERGKSLVPPPADLVRAKVYLAYGAAPVKIKSRQKSRAGAHVEVRLQLVDAESGAVRYSTHTQTPIPARGAVEELLGGGVDGDAWIREVLEKSARDFASRL